MQSKFIARSIYRPGNYTMTVVYNNFETLGRNYRRKSVNYEKSSSTFSVPVQITTLLCLLAPTAYLISRSKHVTCRVKLFFASDHLGFPANFTT